ncbi:MAG TPA: arylesterase [Burkholderiaceae bacterium]
MNRRRVLRHCSALWLSLAASHALAQKPNKPGKPDKRIVVLGDSLSAEYGLARGSGWVALLEKRLAEQKIAASVVNASISGDTSSGGRARLDALLREQKPTLLVIELGANDMLRGLPVADARANLLAMIHSAKAAGARVLLIGMQVPPNFGRAYIESYQAMYAELARSEKVGLVPFLLKGVAEQTDMDAWFQADRIHPLARAHPIILDNVWPEVKRLL